MCEAATHIIRERDRPDFTELMLHNSLVLILTVCSYIGNYVRIGSLVMLSDFAPDVIVYLAKSLVDTPWSGGILTYIPLALTYFYGRLYIFIGYLFRSVWIEAPRMAPEEIQEYWSFLVTLLCVMLVMNTYWFVMILKIGLFILSTGQSRDIQANLSAIDLDSKKAVLSPRSSGRPQQQQSAASSAKKGRKSDNQSHFAALDSLVEARQAILEEPVNPEEYITAMSDDQVREKARFAATADPLKNVESNTDIFQNSDSDEIDYDADLLGGPKSKEGGGLAKLTSGIKIPGFVTQPDKYTKYSLDKVDALGRAANERVAVDFIYKLRGEQPPDAIVPPDSASFAPQYRRREATGGDTEMAASEGVGVRMDNCRVMPEWTPFNQAQRRSRSRSSSQSREPRRRLAEGDNGEQQYSVEGKKSTKGGAISITAAVDDEEEDDDDSDDGDDYSDMPGLMELDID
ncbi:hypothetical protein FOL47_002142 [Perkinsus chesapeaki]|uniref:TLC domain-containing protein n=1 Tax=Perkinsus chesapeaki TaxID=330153 RepID=A0A7J6MGD9_PERCH|nr:hypothetical protein FOL47_002142 [Perkinsus chesapeaki]